MPLVKRERPGIERRDAQVYVAFSREDCFSKAQHTAADSPAAEVLADDDSRNIGRTGEPLGVQQDEPDGLSSICNEQRATRPFEDDAVEKLRPTFGCASLAAMRSAEIALHPRSAYEFVAIKNNLSDFALGRLRSGSITRTFTK